MTAKPLAYQVQPTPEMLRQAAQYVRERGLARGKFVQPTGELCVLGACGVAAGLDPDEAAYMRQVQEYLASVLKGEEGLQNAFLTVTVYNDTAPGAEAVVQLLEQAAEELE